MPFGSVVAAPGPLPAAAAEALPGAFIFSSARPSSHCWLIRQSPQAMAGGRGPPRDGAAADPSIIAESFSLGLSTSGGIAEEQGRAPAIHALREDSGDQVRLVTTFMYRRSLQLQQVSGGAGKMDL